MSQPATAGESSPISLPRGGGAIRGIGESFTANPATGTGSATIPIPTSAGRAGLGPTLALSYDSGAGNGPFGLGWNLSVPSIGRRTDRGLPGYRDGHGAQVDSDTFVLDGEDLVPVVDATGVIVEQLRGDHRVRRYRPRTDNGFARIERWTRVDDRSDVHWRTTSADNATSVYGPDPASRVTDPVDPLRIFRWLVSYTVNDTGEAVVYQHVAEDDRGVPAGSVAEAGRARGAGRYLRRIRYGNRASLIRPDGTVLDPGALPDDTWMFEVVLDFGQEHVTELPAGPDGREFVRATAAATGSWPARVDPFSSYRAGFELRTHRLCRRVLMIHHFPVELGRPDCLVASTELTYRPDAGGSTLVRATQAGYRPQPTAGEPDRYLRVSMPPVDFGYSALPGADELAARAARDVTAEVPDQLPGDLSGDWLDLDGDGVAGIIAEHGPGWYYLRNLSPLGGDGAVLATPRRIDERPAVSLAAPGARWLDLAGDGRTDLAVLDGAGRGFHERTDDRGWEPFRSFDSWPTIDVDDANVRLIDLSGDGLADVLVAEGDAFTWYPSLGEAGFGPGVRVPATAYGRGPRLIFAEATQTIFLADMSGDGLTDLARIRDGEVSYWPNLGYGRFGERVAMDGAPHFGPGFDPGRLRLADLDGSGPADLIYLAPDGPRVHYNRSGNGWSDGYRLAGFPAVDAATDVRVLDLLGTGTAALVWSSPLPGAAGRRLRYLDLMDGKPHLLTSMVNNMGAETRISYAPSTRYALRDERAGRPWATRLPFPVHVVDRVETVDRISGNRYATRYAYHHGYFDGEDREFRGFGMVEHWDSSVLPTLDEPAANLDPASHLPPAMTRTWYHTGAFLTDDDLSEVYAREYYREDAGAPAPLLPDTILPATLLSPTGRQPIELTAAEAREACRAMAGALLRQEVYAVDGTEAQERPYTVSERSYAVELHQRAAGHRAAVCSVHPREQLDVHYERVLVDVGGRLRADPRMTHTLTLEVDAYGAVPRAMSVAYRRRDLPGVLPEQRDTQVLLRTAAVVHYPGETGVYRLGLPVQARTFEVVGLPAPVIEDTRVVPYRFAELAELVEPMFPLAADAPDPARLWPHEQWDWRATPPPTPRLRPLTESRTSYRRDDLDGTLPFGVAGSRGLVEQSYTLALTPGLLDTVLRRSPAEPLVGDPSVLTGTGADEGGYVAMDGGWWVPSGRVRFSDTADLGDPAATAASELARARAHFFRPVLRADPFGRVTRIAYDDADLLPVATEDAAGQVWAAANDYRVLQPYRLTDPNGNRSVVTFDALGMVAASAVQGKAGQSDGDDVSGVDSDPPLAALQNVAADPRTFASGLLGPASERTVYDVDRYRRCGRPAVAIGLARAVHAGEPGGAAGPITVSLTFSDGFGRQIQRKVQAEPGEAVLRGPDEVTASGDTVPGPLRRGPDGAPLPGPVGERWVGTGRVVLNNKGKPVRHYQPFFSATPQYEPEADLTETGVSPIYFYDPLARVVATVHPEGTYAKVVFDPWRQVSSDANDTVTDDPRTDPDTAAYVAAYFAAQPPGWQTWHTARADGTLGDDELDAARKAEAHAHTPGVLHVDPAGRAVRTVAHNRFERAGATVEELVETRTVIDGGGLVRAIADGLGRTVMRYSYDAQGERIHQAGAESGARWMLADAGGQPIRAWDDQGRRFRSEYDDLRRPVAHHVLGADPADPGREILVERIVHGDSPQTGLTRAQARDRNLLTHVHQHFDGAGLVVNDVYDFTGNLLRGIRRLTTGYAEVPDWGAAVPPALDEPMVVALAYDARGRAVSCTAPDGSVVLPRYNEAGLLEQTGVRRPGAGAATEFVTGIEYDARGRRTVVDYANGAHTTHEYDPLTSRATRTRTTRPAGLDALGSTIFADATVVQDLRYVHDPVGNLTRCTDAALAVVFHDNQRVEPVGDYTHDAAYRLVAATGREQVGQAALELTPPPGRGRRDWPFAGAGAHPNDLRALRAYTERYEYDQAGNLTAMRHGTQWTRDYEYAEPSLLEPGRFGNRLSRSTVAGSTETYGYDAAGALTSLNSMGLSWDHAQRLRRVDLGGGGVAHYVYDSSGRRVRTVIERNGAPAIERVYGGGFERYREYGLGGVRLERTTLHVLDGQRRIALIETQTVADGSVLPAPAAVIRYQFGNHLGSATLELDVLARVISYEEFHPFGTSAFQVGPAGAEVGLKRYRFTGRERDDETGFAMHGARYYAPWLGRWTSADPIGTGDGVNLYAYVHNQPVTATDPTGQAGWQKVETEDAGADYYYHPATELGIRKSAVATEVWHYVSPKEADLVVMKFNDEEIKGYTKPPDPKVVTKDIKTMLPQDFQDKYGVGSMDYDKLAEALIPPPEPLYIPEDKTLYMGNGGMLGTSDALDDADLANRIAGLQQPTITGSLYGVAAVALGGDAKEAAKMINIGNSVDGVVMAGIGAAAMVKGKPDTGSGSSDKGWRPLPPGPPKDTGAGKPRLPIVNPNRSDNRPADRIQGATEMVAAKLQANKPLINRYLTPGEAKLASLGPWAERIVFGNAVERALAESSRPTGLLTHTGDIRPAPRGGPDLTGVPGTPFEGMLVQITSENGYWTHFEKADPATVWGLYPGYQP